MGLCDDGPFPLPLWRECSLHIHNNTLSFFLLYSLPTLKKEKKGVEQNFVFNSTVLFGAKLTLCFCFSYLRWAVLQRLPEVLFWQLWGLKSCIHEVNWVLRIDAIAEVFVLSYWPALNCSKGVTVFTSVVNQHLNCSVCYLISFVTFWQHPKYTLCFPNKDGIF